MSKIKFFIQQSWLLIAASFLFGLLIAVTNAALMPRIEQNEIDKLNDLMASLIDDANSFELAIEEAPIPGTKGKILKTDIYKAVGNDGETVGFAFIATGAGFADKIKLVIAVDGNCKKTLGFKVLSSNETPGFGDKIKNDYFGKQFKGIPAGKLELVKVGNPEEMDSQIIAIGGATVSSVAVVEIFNVYADCIKEQLKSEGLLK